MAKLVVVPPKVTPSNDMQILAGHVDDCTACPLHKFRRFSVVGSGPITAPFMIIGEAPGASENDDMYGRPFIGRAGMELTRMLEDAGISRGDCYITNMVKCWPGPGNPDPTEDEIAACSDWLTQQINIVRPRGIITFGRFSTGRWLTWSTMGAVQGHIRRVKITPNAGRDRGPSDADIRRVDGDSFITYVCPIYHPAYILRNRAERANSVALLKAFRKVVGYPLG